MCGCRQGEFPRDVFAWPSAASDVIAMTLLCGTVECVGAVCCSQRVIAAAQPEGAELCLVVVWCALKMYLL